MPRFSLPAEFWGLQWSPGGAGTFDALLRVG